MGPVQGMPAERSGTISQSGVYRSRSQDGVRKVDGAELKPCELETDLARGHAKLELASTAVRFSAVSLWVADGPLVEGEAAVVS